MRATRSTASGPSHPEYPMALFKRAQVSVLLNEPDRQARIARARQHADATTRRLIEREKLFRQRPPEPIESKAAVAKGPAASATGPPS